MLFLGESYPSADQGDCFSVLIFPRMFQLFIPHNFLEPEIHWLMYDYNGNTKNKAELSSFF
jgi:hypothetical protein